MKMCQNASYPDNNRQFTIVLAQSARRRHSCMGDGHPFLIRQPFGLQNVQYALRNILNHSALLPFSLANLEPKIILRRLIFQIRSSSQSQQTKGLRMLRVSCNLQQKQSCGVIHTCL